MKRQVTCIRSTLTLFAALNGCTQAVDADSPAADEAPPVSVETETTSAGASFMPVPALFMEGVPQEPDTTTPVETSFLHAPANIQTKVFECSSTTPQSYNNVACVVPSDWVVVGGGARVNSTGQGALLTATYPYRAPGVEAWVAISKDHMYTDNHTLTTYAIGLKLNGLSATQLRSQVNYYCSTGPTGSLSTAFAAAPAGWTVIGGGAIASYSGAGHLLYTSAPAGPLALPGVGGNTWVGASKDHGTPDASGQVRACAIAIKTCPTGFASCLRAGQTGSRNDACSGGYCTQTQTNPNPNGAATTGLGGATSWGAYGRMLVDLKPTTLADGSVGSLVVRSKDHGWWDGGWLGAYMVNLSLQPPPGLR